MYVYVYLLKVILLSWKIRPNYEERERVGEREKVPYKVFQRRISLSTLII